MRAIHLLIRPATEILRQQPSPRKYQAVAQA